MGKFSGKTFNRHLYNPWDVFSNVFANVIGVDKVFDAESAAISDTLPPISFAVYTTKNN